VTGARSDRARQRTSWAFVLITAVALGSSLPLEAAAQGDDMARAKEAYSRGQELFDAGDFEAAVAAFQESLDAFPHYRTIFNIALCHEKLGQIAEAVAMYQRYVDWPAEVPNREEVAAKLEELRAELPPEPEPDDGSASASGDPGGSASAPDGSGATGGSSTSNDEEQGPDLILPGWVTVSVGAAGLITGGVLIGLAQSKSNEIAKVDGVYYDPAEHDALQEDGRKLEVGGWVAGGIGAAAVTAGLIMLLVSERPVEEDAAEEPEATVAFGLGPGDSALGMSAKVSF